ncbi:hypothetical protein [Proteiniclasticum sp. QWL-01]|uniref:hypothetical protein n=1 Tax=Proteiniclasticum sp. QWL-01 TaxID=3036945 RepID=UPI002410BDCC|nr:hypothetical protein [Proteiniclasticum sp. QWL-01]WFF73177.1 hypothetical protein P6M73_01565 [Proteiniclasticum sp. QWL-01]
MTYNGMIIFGEMGSGKDTLADRIIEADGRFKKYGLGDIIRLIKKVSTVDPAWFGNERTFMQLAADKLREIDMDILNHFALAKMLEENLGDFTLTKEAYREDLNRLFEKILRDHNVIPMIVGGRTWKDYDYWTSRGFLAVGIEVDAHKRMERLVLRDGQEVAEKSDSTHNTEKDVREIIERCELKVDNNGSLEDLDREVERVTQYFFKA